MPYLKQNLRQKFLPIRQKAWIYWTKNTLATKCPAQRPIPFLCNKTSRFLAKLYHHCLKWKEKGWVHFRTIFFIYKEWIQPSVSPAFMSKSPQGVFLVNLRINPPYCLSWLISYLTIWKTNLKHFQQTVHCPKGNRLSAI